MTKTKQQQQIAFAMQKLKINSTEINNFLLYYKHNPVEWYNVEEAVKTQLEEILKTRKANKSNNLLNKGKSSAINFNL